MAPDKGPGGWAHWSQHVIKELERLNETMERLEALLNKTRTEVAVLKVKASIWGLLGGAVPAAATLLIIWFKN